MYKKERYELDGNIKIQLATILSFNTIRWVGCLRAVEIARTLVHILWPHSTAFTE